MEKLNIECMALEVIGERITRLIWDGAASDASVRAIMDYSSRLHEELGEGAIVSAIIIARDVGIARKARKALTELGRLNPWTRCAVVGASFETKVMGELVVKGMHLLHIKTGEIGFFDQEAEAIAWCEAVG